MIFLQPVRKTASLGKIILSAIHFSGLRPTAQTSFLLKCKCSFPFGDKLKYFREVKEWKNVKIFAIKGGGALAWH